MRKETDYPTVIFNFSEPRNSTCPIKLFSPKNNLQTFDRTVRLDRIRIFRRRIYNVSVAQDTWNRILINPGPEIRPIISVIAYRIDHSQLLLAALCCTCIVSAELKLLLSSWLYAPTIVRKPDRGLSM